MVGQGNRKIFLWARIIFYTVHSGITKLNNLDVSKFHDINTYKDNSQQENKIINCKYVPAGNAPINE